MLIQFTVENFLSFRDRSTFSMVGVNGDRQHPEHLAENEAGKDRPVLPIAAIYGANGAGKSNLIQAVSFAKDLIVEGTRSSQSISVPTFKLGDCGQKPSKFEFIFTVRGAQYSYGFKITKEQILQEWLYGIPAGKKKEVMYFERITSEDKKTTLEYGTSLIGRSQRKKQFLDFIAQGTRYNQLFLTESIDRNVEDLIPVFDWFRKTLTIIPAEARYRGLAMMVAGDKSFTDFLSGFLQIAGVGIDSIGVDQVELDFNRHFPGMPETIKNNLLQEFAEADLDSVTMLNLPEKNLLLLKDQAGELFVLQLKTIHRSAGGQLVDFSMDEESEGTQRLINLIPALFILKASNEKVIFIDELDRRLHPLLSRCFIQSALGCRSQKNQMIFTTHDTNVLDLDLLRRDEIWFVEKNEAGSSSIFSLAEFKIRPDLKLEKGYLSGRFGAIPFFGDPEKLGWIGCEDDLPMETSQK
jgi:uncharacterized protein